jgi:putative flippase GtrA
VLAFATEILHLGPYEGRVLSFLVGVTVTWLLNRRFTFRGLGGAEPLLRQWVKYASANIVGFAINYGTYALCVAFIPLFGAFPVLAVLPGSAAGLLFNFTAAKKLVFR